MMASWLDKIAALPQTLQGWLSGGNSVNMFVTGKTGVGKSSLINGIVGNNVAEEGDSLDRGTVTVQAFSFKYHDVDIRIWDSPGLQDGLDKEEEYIRDMQHKGCADSDLVLYCAKMSDTRFRKEDHDAIRKLTIGLGKKIWGNAIFVMTFANDVRARRERGQKLTPAEEHKRNRDFFKNRLEEYKTKLVEAIVEAGVDAKIAASIPIVPAGYDEEQALPDRDNWLSPLWYVSILRMKERSQPALLKANLHRIKLPDQITPEDFEKPLHEQPIIYMPAPVKYGAPPAVFTVIGAIIGGVAGPAGAVAGGFVGATVGGGMDGLMAYFASGGSETDTTDSKNAQHQPTSSTSGQQTLFAKTDEVEGNAGTEPTSAQPTESLTTEVEEIDAIQSISDRPIENAMWKLPGIEECDRTSVVVHSSQGQLIDWNGLKLHIHEGSLPADMHQCKIEIIASLAGQYEIPENSSLVSAIFWLHCEPQCKFIKPITVEIQHCSTSEDLSRLKIVRAFCSQKQLPYNFKPLGGRFNTYTSYGAVEVNSFSGFGAIEESPDSGRLYYSQLFYRRHHRHQKKHEIHIIFIWNTEAHLNDLSKKYPEDCFLEGCHQIIELDRDVITIDLERAKWTKVMDDQWELLPVKPVVTKKALDDFKPGRGIVNCVLEAQPLCEDFPQLVHEITLNGIKPPHHQLTLSYMPLMKDDSSGVTQQPSRIPATVQTQMSAHAQSLKFSEEMSNEQLGVWLSNHPKLMGTDYQEEIGKLKNAKVNGHAFLNLNDSRLERFGVSLGFQFTLLSIIEDLGHLPGVFHVQKRSQQPPGSEGLPSRHQSSVVSGATTAVQHQPTSSAVGQQIYNEASPSAVAGPLGAAAGGAESLTTEVEEIDAIQSISDQPVENAIWKLPGIEECDRTSVVVHSSQGQLINWNGLKLHIHEGSLPADIHQCKIEIIASLAGQYEIPENSSLVSAIFWLRCEPQCKFIKPITVEIQHCSTSEDLSRLKIVRAFCSQKQLPYNFKPLGGRFNTYTSYGAVEVKSFSGFGAIEESPDSGRLYYSQLFYRSHHRHQKTHEIHIIFIWNTEAHLNDLSRKYHGNCFLEGCHQIIELDQDVITVDLERAKWTKVMDGQWELLPVKPMVTKRALDDFKPGRGIANCVLEAQPLCEDFPQLVHEITLNGIKPPHHQLTLSYMPLTKGKWCPTLSIFIGIVLASIIVLILSVGIAAVLNLNQSDADETCVKNIVKPVDTGCSWKKFKQTAELTKIKDFYDLRWSVQDIGDWQGLCKNLEVDIAVMEGLVNERSTDYDKKDSCLQSYVKADEGSWEEVVIAVARPPLKNKGLAKDIAKDRLHSPNKDTVIYMLKNCQTIH